MAIAVETITAPHSPFVRESKYCPTIPSLPKSADIFAQEEFLEPKQLTEHVTLISPESHENTFSANSYMIHTNDGLVLIDCGSYKGLPFLEQNLDSQGYALSDIRAVLLTHAHEDHAGAAAELQKNGTKIIVPRQSLEPLITGDPGMTASFLYGTTFHPLYPDRVVTNGEIISFGDEQDAQFEVLSTPGHSPDSTTYKLIKGGEEDFFVGDLLWGHIHDLIGSNVQEWRQSLFYLYEHDPHALFPGHANADYLPHPQRALTKQLSHFGEIYREGFHGMRDPWPITS